MCLLDSCCCCIPLTVGMHLICLSYMGYFSYFALFGDPNFQRINILQWYVYGGVFSSICGWIGLRWEKKFLVSILFLYDVCVAIARSGMLYMYYYYPHNDNLIDNENSAEQQVVLLTLQLYFLWVQLSYLQKEEPPAPTFHPVPQNVIVTEVRRGNLSAPVATAFPVEYQPQLPYSIQPFPGSTCVNASAPSIMSQYPVYAPNAHLYPSTTYPNAENVTMGAQLNNQPFPYDAPPPYSEIKPTSSVPSAPSL